MDRLEAGVGPEAVKHIDDINDRIAVIDVMPGLPYILAMARLTIRNLDDSVLQWLRERGAARGVSMEQEARDVLAAALGLPTPESFDRRGFPPEEEEESDGF